MTHHNTSKVNSYSISYGYHDHSDIAYYIRNHSQSFVDVFHIASDAAVAGHITNELQLDVLIDITSHTYNNRLPIAAMKPAPVVINYLGFPGTTACDGFDYTLIDSHTIPAELASSLFTEKLIYLPYNYQTNTMPLYSVPCLDRSVCLERLIDSGGKRYNYKYHVSGKTSSNHSNEDKTNNVHIDSVSNTFAISETEFPSRSDVDVNNMNNTNITFDENDNNNNDNNNHHHMSISSKLKKSTPMIHLCSLNSNKKFDTTSFHVWMNILSRLPQAVLWLMWVPPESQRYLQIQMLYHGLSPMRIRWLSKLPWKEHLYRSAGCDLVLDTFVYGAHTTASDVLWMWLPIVSLHGYGSQRMPSKVAASIIQSLSLSIINETAAGPGVGNIKHKSQQRVGNEYIEDVEHILIVSTLREYENTVVRLAQSILTLLRLKLSIGSHVMKAATFNADIMQVSIERAYTLSWEIYIMTNHRSNNNNNISNKKYHIVVGSSSLIQIYNSDGDNTGTNNTNDHSINNDKLQQYITSYCDHNEEFICQEVLLQMFQSLSLPLTTTTEDDISINNMSFEHQNTAHSSVDTLLWNRYRDSVLLRIQASFPSVLRHHNLSKSTSINHRYPSSSAAAINTTTSTKLFQYLHQNNNNASSNQMKQNTLDIKREHKENNNNTINIFVNCSYFTSDKVIAWIQRLHSHRINIIDILNTIPDLSLVNHQYYYSMQQYNHTIDDSSDIFFSTAVYHLKHLKSCLQDVQSSYFQFELYNQIISMIVDCQHLVNLQQDYSSEYFLFHYYIQDELQLYRIPPPTLSPSIDMYTSINQPNEYTTESSSSSSSSSISLTDIMTHIFNIPKDINTTTNNDGNNSNSHIDDYNRNNQDILSSRDLVFMSSSTPASATSIDIRPLKYLKSHEIQTTLVSRTATTHHPVFHSPPADTSAPLSQIESLFSVSKTHVMNKMMATCSVCFVQTANNIPSSNNNNNKGLSNVLITDIGNFQLWTLLTNLAMSLHNYAITVSEPSNTNTHTHNMYLKDDPDKSIAIGLKYESALLFTSAFMIDPSYERLKAMGLAWQTAGAVDYGFYMSTAAMLYEVTLTYLDLYLFIFIFIDMCH